MPAEPTHRARVPILRHAAQEGGLARELHSLLRGELDLFPVVEPALDDLLRRRIPGQGAERGQAQGSGHVEVEQVGHAPAGGPLSRKTPEHVAEVAVGGELAARLASLRPEAFGQ